jgi:hypothetical protein
MQSERQYDGEIAPRLERATDRIRTGDILDHNQVL